MEPLVEAINFAGSRLNDKILNFLFEASVVEYHQRGGIVTFGIPNVHSLPRDGTVLLRSKCKTKASFCCTRFFRFKEAFSHERQFFHGFIVETSLLTRSCLTISVIICLPQTGQRMKMSTVSLMTCNPCLKELVFY